MARIADRTAERFAESAQLTDGIAARNADQFAESTKVSDRNAKRFADRFTKRVNCRTIHSINMVCRSICRAFCCSYRIFIFDTKASGVPRILIKGGLEVARFARENFKVPHPLVCHAHQFEL